MEVESSSPGKDSLEHRQGPEAGKHRDNRDIKRKPVPQKPSPLLKPHRTILSRDQRCRSSRLLRNIDSSPQLAELTLLQQNKQTHKQEDLLIRTSPVLGDHPHPHPHETDTAKALVFNRFSKNQTLKIHRYLFLMQDPSFSVKLGESLTLLAKKIREYLEQLESNNQKLLEINYFFQKEFNSMMTERQLMKREKCSRGYCLECRYHLEKENDWKEQKSQMAGVVEELKQEVKSLKNLSRESVGNVSIVMQAGEVREAVHQASSLTSSDDQLLRLQDELSKRDQQYLVLLNEYNYLNTSNKDIKTKLTNLMQQYKYLSIENRTLLKVKAQSVEKELECTKYKRERDQFKRKVIQFHGKMQQMKDEDEDRDEGRCAKCEEREEGEEELFSLLSGSTEHHGSQLSMN